MELLPAVKMSQLFPCWRLPGNQSGVHAKSYSLPGLYLTSKIWGGFREQSSSAKAPEAAKQACALKNHQKHLDRSPCI